MGTLEGPAMLPASALVDSVALNGSESVYKESDYRYEECEGRHRVVSCSFSSLISASLFAALSVSSLISASFLLKTSSFSLSSNSVSISIVSCSAKHSTKRHQCFITIRCGDRAL